MSIAAVVTGGFGTFAGVRFIPTLGYLSDSTPIPVPAISSGGGGKRKKKYKDFAPDPSKARQALGDFREELALKRQRESQVEIALKKQEAISADKRAEKLTADGRIHEAAKERELAIRLDAERREEEEFMVLLLMMAS